MVTYLTHNSFYVIDGSTSIKYISYYRMGGSIVDNNYIPFSYDKKPFVAKQSLIVPDPINSDDKFK
jgi:hypothetical protein